MIPRSLPSRQPTHWQSLLAASICDPQQLLQALDLDPALLPPAIQPPVNFRLRVPAGFVARMRKGDPEDPLLRQVLPLQEEGIQTPGYSTDPLSELSDMPVPGILHKYQGRVLLTLTGACAIHCRYCFRRHYPYNESNPLREHWQATLDYLQRQSASQEVILSGGDPLTLPDQRLAALVRDLEDVSHLQRLRLHSRVPVVLPERVDASLLEWVRNTRLQVILVIHANHPNEIDATVHQAMHALRSAGVTLFNQSVLLRGVNNRADTLIRLSERLFQSGVLPYYLHQLDAVQGAAHFSVNDEEARTLLARMRERLPGYLVPRLVRERPGYPSKLPL